MPQVVEHVEVGVHAVHAATGPHDCDEVLKPPMPVPSQVPEQPVHCLLIDCEQEIHWSSVQPLQLQD